MAELLYPKLSYNIVGAIYEVYNNLGYEHPEKVYQRSLAKEFDRRKISYKKELYFPIEFK